MVKEYLPSRLTCASANGDSRAAFSLATSRPPLRSRPSAASVQRVFRSTTASRTRPSAPLVFLSFVVGLAELAAPAVEDLPREPVAGLLDGELPVHGVPVGLAGGIDDGGQVQGPGGPAV
jgi:hypothetical protein